MNFVQVIVPSLLPGQRLRFDSWVLGHTHSVVWIDDDLIFVVRILSLLFLLQNLLLLLSQFLVFVVRCWLVLRIYFAAVLLKPSLFVIVKIGLR